MRVSILITVALMAASCSDRPMMADDAAVTPDVSDLGESDLEIYTRRTTDAALPTLDFDRERPPIQGACQASLACQSKSDCEAMGYLDCEGGQCIMCREDLDCPNIGPLKMTCNEATRWCQFCTSDADCTIGGKTAGTGKCEPKVGQCIGCDDDDDCASAGAPHARRCTTVATLLGSTRMCVGCSTDDDCSGSALKGCDTIAGTCSKCTTDAECCPIFSPTCSLTCDSTSGQCLCNSDQQCADAHRSAVFKCSR